MRHYKLPYVNEISSIYPNFRKTQIMMYPNVQKSYMIFSATIILRNNDFSPWCMKHNWHFLNLNPWWAKPPNFWKNYRVKSNHFIKKNNEQIFFRWKRLCDNFSKSRNTHDVHGRHKYILLRNCKFYIMQFFFQKWDKLS